MFGEIKSSSREIRSASPTAKVFALIGYKNIADAHLIAARYDSYVSEIYCMRENKKKPIVGNVLFQYWKDVSKAVTDSNSPEPKVTKPGKLINR